MSGHDRDDEQPTGEERPRVKVTDKRRIHRDGGPEAEEPQPSAPEMPQTELERARADAAEYKDHLLRLKAEFDNYRKRVLKEQTRAVEMASEPLVRRLLEVLDEFDLALVAAEQHPDFDKFLHGVELVYAKLLDSLRAEGLERIPAVGEPFDPELHEALMQTGEGDGEPVVADIFRQGYRLRGRVLRPAGVKVVRK
jgi:molecular chaperone GrpE